MSKRKVGSLIQSAYHLHSPVLSLFLPAVYRITWRSCLRAVLIKTGKEKKREKQNRTAIILEWEEKEDIEKCYNSTLSFFFKKKKKLILEILE